MTLVRSILITTTCTILQGTTLSNTTDQAHNAANFLDSSVKSKTLMLASRPEYFVNGKGEMFGKGLFFRMDMGGQEALRQFSFKSRVEQSDTPPIEMRLSADKFNAAIVVQTEGGNPYRLHANNLFVMCDPVHPGGLAYYEGGSFFWGLLKSINQKKLSTDSTSTSFEMEFDTIAGISTIILDAEHLIQRAATESTNTLISAELQLIEFYTPGSKLAVQFSNHNNIDSFGIQRIELSAIVNGAVFSTCMDDFKIGEASLNGLHDLSLEHVKSLNLPLRSIDSYEFSYVTKSIALTQDFPSSPAEAAASEKLRQLIESLWDAPVVEPIDKTNAPNKTSETD